MDGPERSHTKRMAREFIAANRAASLATADPAGTPHVSVVYCVVKPDLTIYFSTRVEGRKFTNITIRPSVALAFYNEQQLQMIQLRGEAHRLDDLKREQVVMGDLMRIRYKDPHWPLPSMQLFHRGETNEVAVMEVVPTKMTFADFSTPRPGHFKPAFHRII